MNKSSPQGQFKLFVFVVSAISWNRKTVTARGADSTKVGRWAGSVTRFGKISPLLQNFKSFWAAWKSFVKYFEKYEPAQAKCVC